LILKKQELKKLKLSKLLKLIMKKE